MKHKTIPHDRLRSSSLASFAIESMKPSDSTLKLADKVHEGKISREDAISMICQKYCSDKHKPSH